MTKTKNELKPFHESIVDAIRISEPDVLMGLLSFLEHTAIEQGHDKIVSAIKERLSLLGWKMSHFDYLIESILEQKVEAEAASNRPKDHSF